jgi:hypothetical protein
MIVFILYYWLSELVSAAFALISTLFFSAHPALIFYATFLDTTLLSAFLILAFCYLLWRIRAGRNTPVCLLAASFLLLFFTRSLFQWHWLIVLPLCLALLRYPSRKLIMVSAIATAAIGLYTVKQLFLFNLSATSSFTGLNLCNSIGVAGVQELYRPAAAPSIETEAADVNVLTRVEKLDGSANFNHIHYLELNRSLERLCWGKIMSSSPGELALAYIRNLNIYLLPSSRYTSHVIVDHLPWRSGYDLAFSTPILPVLLLGAVLVWGVRVKRSEVSRSIGLCLPILAIALLSILFERGENMRFKFFIEPILFLFIASQSYRMANSIVAAIRERTRHGTS